MKLYRAVAAALRAAGIERMFGVMGDANMRIVASYIDDEDGSFVGAAHEAGAVAMADGYSRLTGRLGVAALTHGPGVTNGLTALTEAVRAHSCLVVLTGSTPPQREHNQWLDLRAAANLVGAEYRQVLTPASAMDDLALALRLAVSRRRPVLLDVPAGLMEAEVGDATSAFGLVPEFPPPCAPEGERLDRALGVMASANRPLVLIGQGAVFAGAREEIWRLADVLHAPVAHTVMAMSYLEGHPLDLGIFGSESHSLAIRYISQADCIIAIGAGLNTHTTAGGDLLRGKRVVHCDNDPAALSACHPASVEVLSDARVFAGTAAESLSRLGPRAEPAWVARLRSELLTFDPSDDFEDHSTVDTIDIRTAMCVLDKIFPHERLVVTDIGWFKTAPWRYLRHRSQGFTQSGSFGAIGLGLQMAVGAAFADLSRPTLAVVGDGGLMMGLTELATAVEHSLPLIIAVANDGAYNAEYRKLAEFGHDPNHSRRVWPSFAEMARGFGADGEVIRTRTDMEKLEPRLAEVTGPLLLDIRMDPALDSRRYK